MRMYYIRNKKTGEILRDVQYIPGRGLTVAPWHSDGKWVVRWDKITCMDNYDGYKDIRQINYFISTMVGKRLNNDLDNCEILAVKKTYVSVKHTVNLEKMRSKYEQESVVLALRGC